VTPHSTRNRTAFALTGLLALFASLLVALTLAGPAMASACGDKVLADWFDNGRIDRLYPLHCYEEAIDSIPDDIRDYANAEEVISRALQSAVRGDIAQGGCDPSPDGSADDCKGGTGSGPGSGANGGTGDPEGSGGTGSEATPEVDSSGMSAVPIPLLVLGGMSLALLAAGGAGYISRRRTAAAAADDLPHGPGDDDIV
jgi:hypothetical protein